MKSGDHIQIEDVDLGPIYAGKSRVADTVITNTSNNRLYLNKAETTDSRLKVINFPRELRPQQQGIVELSYETRVTDDKNLKAQVKFEYDAELTFD